MRDNDSDVTEFIQSGSIHEHAKRQLHLFQTIDTCKQSEVHIEFARSRPAHAQSRSIDIELLGRKRSLGILLGKHHDRVSAVENTSIRHNRNRNRSGLGSLCTFARWLCTDIECDNRNLCICGLLLIGALDIPNWIDAFWRGAEAHDSILRESMTFHSQDCINVVFSCHRIFSLHNLHLGCQRNHMQLALRNLARCKNGLSRACSDHDVLRAKLIYGILTGNLHSSLDFEISEIHLEIVIVGKFWQSRFDNGEIFLIFSRDEDMLIGKSALKVERFRQESLVRLLGNPKVFT